MSYLFYTQELTDALMDRIDDEQLSDIMYGGCIAGVSNFISYCETNQFFDDHEDSVEDVCFDFFGNDWIRDLSGPGITSIMQLKNAAVWFVVEQYAQHRYDYMSAIIAA